MCLIVRGTVRNLFDLDLGRAEKCNADGWGIHTADTIIYSFELSGLDIFDALDMLSLDTTATVHFRFATHGEVNRENAHPFDLGKNTFLMHNGVLRDAVFQCQHGIKSDTALLADYLRDMKQKARKAFLRLLASGNRFCLLQGNKWQRFGSWSHDEATDTWHSNEMLLPKKFTAWGKSASSAYNPLEWDFADDNWAGSCEYYNTRPTPRHDKKNKQSRFRW